MVISIFERACYTTGEFQQAFPVISYILKKRYSYVKLDNRMLALQSVLIKNKLLNLIDYECFLFSVFCEFKDVHELFRFIANTHAFDGVRIL